ncbi:catalytic LigB subunit of putative aromatic ring-opening dioxygenase [Boeremia exigua]|uniref:catalytic LigB subunit of putative aromatic ring-opening dioxygenase n=1 Tax=Boeremia exigua TaxID=749465 RepID=UPI001E8DAF09|nr:catalytic LigB subunit of putative aromatic ring-opening dioxygenase [Boeremia exigua]KAH6612402.1 catalytic LigB subunit of putative aromatic ring-opening dioxygenase [Boeremia exigua]
MSLPLSHHGPSFFVSHGTGPFPLLGGDEQRPFLDTLKRNRHVIEGVKAIILFSAHWETDEPHISGGTKPGLYYDYEAQRKMLPPAAFEFQYDAPGDPNLARVIATELAKHGFKPQIDYERGFDHAVYVPMTVLRPEADIPIVQMSILKSTTEREATERNLALGQAMRCFRDDGYAILGSGGSYHDFNAIAGAFFKLPSDPRATVQLDTGAYEFEDWLADQASISDVSQRCEALARWRNVLDSWIAHTEGSSDHLMPFMVTAGAGGESKGRRIDYCEVVGAPMGFYLW